MVIVLICFLLVFTLIGLSLLWQHHVIRQDVIDKHNPRKARSSSEIIISQEDTIDLRDKPQLGVTPKNRIIYRERLSG